MVLEYLPRFALKSPSFVGFYIPAPWSIWDIYIHLQSFTSVTVFRGTQIDFTIESFSFLLLKMPPASDRVRGHDKRAKYCPSLSILHTMAFYITKDELFIVV